MITVETFNFGDYRPKIISDGKKIKDCTCDCKWGKNNQDAWKEGKTLCKHIQSAMMHLDLKTKKGVKKKKKMLGPTKLPKWLRDAYIKTVGYCCEDCHLIFPEEGLDIHRIIPGHKGGTYRPGNCKVLCRKDHKKYAEEW